MSQLTPDQLHQLLFQPIYLFVLFFLHNQHLLMFLVDYHLRPILLDGPHHVLTHLGELVLAVRHRLANHDDAHNQKNCQQEIMEILFEEFDQVVHVGVGLELFGKFLTGT